VRHSEAGGQLPIAEHGLIGDLHTAALVGTEGTIDWFCCPRFDSPSVFGALLDAERGGHWRVTPEGEWTSKQLYVPDTAVLVTRFLSDDGIGELTDFLAVDEAGQSSHRLCRSLLCVRGEVTFTVEVEPRLDYARADHTTTLVDGGAVFASPELTIALAASQPLERTAGGVRARVTLRHGERATFVLHHRPDSDEQPDASDDCGFSAAFAQTVRFWRGWAGRSRYTGRWREMVTRSALTLKMLTYLPTGAVVAAPTTSLPEQVGGGRNWDYRFVWVRDAAFSLYALLRLGFTEEAMAFLGWLSDRLTEVDPERDGDAGPLQPIYGIDGRRDLPEFTLEHLSGYRGSRPVRIGNGAADQLQLDVYGELVDSMYLANKYARPLTFEEWEHLTRLVDWVCEHWDQADEGVWEVRGGRRDFTYSRVLSWVAIERAIRVARQRGLPADLVRWSASRDAVYRQVMDRGWDARRRSFVQHYGGPELDASLLLMPLVKFITPADPRWSSTLDAIGRELVDDTLVYRYDPVLSPDGLEGAEGTFSMCSFWYVEALTRAGRLDEARLAFEKMLTYANHLGLYSEQIAANGELLGNFPQAFTHLALISAAYNLDRALG